MRSMYITHNQIHNTLYYTQTLQHTLLHTLTRTTTHTLWLQGYRQSSEFIITQTPLAATVRDFWTMVWQNNAQVLVSLPDAPTGQVRNCRSLLSHRCCGCCC